MISATRFEDFHLPFACAIADACTEAQVKVSGSSLRPILMSFYLWTSNPTRALEVVISYAEGVSHVEVASNAGAVWVERKNKEGIAIEVLQQFHLSPVRQRYDDE